MGWCISTYILGIEFSSVCPIRACRPVTALGPLFPPVPVLAWRRRTRNRLRLGPLCHVGVCCRDGLGKVGQHVARVRTWWDVCSLRLGFHAHRSLSQPVFACLLSLGTRWLSPVGLVVSCGVVILSDTLCPSAVFICLAMRT